MNLWAKRIGQLAVLAVALFFYSCEDETSTLGFKNPNEKFEIKFVDIPVTSSTLLLDSIPTSNYFASNDLNRLLVGRYEDDVFGTVTASAFTQFLPVNAPNTYKKHLDSVYYVYDSVSLRIDPDYYAYGYDDGDDENKGMLQQLSVHELEQQLSATYKIIVNGNTGGQQVPTETEYSYPQNFYSKNTTAYIAEPLANIEYYTNLQDYNFQLTASGKVDRSVTVRLDQSFGERLFDLALEDTTSFRSASTFPTKFPGLAILPEANDKIIGLDPRYDSMVLKVHYRSFRKDGNTVKDTLSINFKFANLVSYTKIDADRSSSDLSAIATKYQPSEDGELRYIQAGTGVAVKLDFSKFYEFAAAHEQLAINSAEIKINNINIASTYHMLPPTSLLVKVVKPNNRFRKLGYPGLVSQYEKDVELINDYRGFFNFDSQNKTVYYSTPADSTLNVLNDGGSFFTLNYSDEDNWYRGSASLFFQQLFNNKDNEDNGKLPLTSVILIPYEPSYSTSVAYGRNVYGKSVDRVSFDKDDIVLRIYYTVPLVD